MRDYFEQKIAEIFLLVQGVWDGLIRLTDVVPIDLILLALIFFMFYRFIWVMYQRTRVWDNLSRSLVAVFASTGGVYAYVVVNALVQDYGAQAPLLWLIRLSLFVSISWCQFELNKELKKMPSVLFTRDRIWVRERIGSVEDIRALLLTLPETPVDLIQKIDSELEEMYRFKEVVRKEDERHGIYEKPGENVQVSFASAENSGVSSAISQEEYSS